MGNELMPIFQGRDFGLKAKAVMHSKAKATMHKAIGYSPQDQGHKFQTQAQFPLPELTSRVDGWLVSITRQHRPCWRARVSTSPVN